MSGVRFLLEGRWQGLSEYLAEAGEEVDRRLPAGSQDSGDGGGGEADIGGASRKMRDGRGGAGGGADGFGKLQDGDGLA